MRTLLSQTAGLLALVNLTLFPLLPRAIADYSGRGWERSPADSDLSLFLCYRPMLPTTTPEAERRSFSKEQGKDSLIAPLAASRMDCYECVKVGRSIPQRWCDSETCENVMYWSKERLKCRYNCGDGFTYAGCGPPAKVNCLCLHGGAMPDCQDDNEKACGTSPCGT